MIDRRRLLAIGAASVASTQVSASAAGTVSGRAVDQDGSPLPGIRVEAVYVTVAARRLPYGGKSIKAEALTGPDGRYEISIARLPPGEYYAHAYEMIENGDRRLTVDLVPENRATFGSHEAAIRDFRRVMVEESPEMPYGNGGVFVLENAILDSTDLTGSVVTLAPSGRGHPIVRTVRRTGEGLVVTGIPFGSYRASVTLARAPLLLQLGGGRDEEPPRESIVHDFTMGALGNQFRVMAKQR